MRITALVCVTKALENIIGALKGVKKPLKKHCILAGASLWETKKKRISKVAARTKIKRCTKQQRMEKQSKVKRNVTETVQLLKRWKCFLSINLRKHSTQQGKSDGANNKAGKKQVNKAVAAVAPPQFQFTFYSAHFQLLVCLHLAKVQRCHLGNYGPFS